MVPNTITINIITNELILKKRLTLTVYSVSLKRHYFYLKSQTFRVAWADPPTLDGPDRPKAKGYFQVFTNLEKHITLLEGRYPNPFPSGLSQEELADPGLEIEAMIGSEAAETFGVGVGDRLILGLPTTYH